MVPSCVPDDDDDPDDLSPRDKFIGTWLCVEGSQMTYTVIISTSATNTSEVKLENFHHFGESESALGSVAGYAMTLPEQTICDGTWIVKGSGMMSSNQKDIVYQYTVSDGVATDTINATYTKQ